MNTYILSTLIYGFNVVGEFESTGIVRPHLQAICDALPVRDQASYRGAAHAPIRSVDSIVETLDGLISLAVAGASHGRSFIALIKDYSLLRFLRTFSSTKLVFDVFWNNLDSLTIRR